MIVTRSLSEVAKMSGFAKSTVSLALRNDPRIAVETRRIIKDCAQKIGYQPDPLWSIRAQHLFRQTALTKTMNISFLVGMPARVEKYESGLRTLLEPLGYGIQVMHLAKEISPASITRRLVDKGVRGLILAPAQTYPHMDCIDFDRFACVSCGMGWFDTGFHTVSHDVHAAMRSAIHRVHRRGYRRIGVIPHMHAPVAMEDHVRVASAHYALSEINPGGTPVPPLLCRHGDAQSMVAWVCKHRPDAVIAFGDADIGIFREAGFRIPEDFAFVALNTHDESVAGMVPNEEDVATRSAEWLDLLLRRDDHGRPARRELLLIPMEWRDGPSLAHAPPRCARQSP